jgi:hypothetical protein
VQEQHLTADLCRIANHQKIGRGLVDWEIHFIGGSVVRARKHAAGAKKAPVKQKRSAALEAS